jgi:hypothetical protein
MKAMSGGMAQWRPGVPSDFLQNGKAANILVTLCERVRVLASRLLLALCLLQLLSDFGFFATDVA